MQENSCHEDLQEITVRSATDQEGKQWGLDVEIYYEGVQRFLGAT